MTSGFCHKGTICFHKACQHARGSIRSVTITRCTPCAMLGMVASLHAHNGTSSASRMEHRLSRQSDPSDGQGHPFVLLSMPLRNQPLDVSRPLLYEFRGGFHDRPSRRPDWRLAPGLDDLTLFFFCSLLLWLCLPPPLPPFTDATKWVGERAVPPGASATISSHEQ
jgi:hypothetical protein